jgi:3-oxoacyl-[acyl-carrier-protein] synthase III
MSNTGTSVIFEGTGSYAPRRVVTNDDLAKIVDTSDEWIATRSGIRERRIADETETNSEMATRAAQAALADAGVTAADIDLIIVGTCTPDSPLPAVAVHVQRKLGIKDVPAFDVVAACSGFLYALDVADAMIRSGRYKRALIIGSEKLSAFTDWTDRTTCVLFGDGAGAAVIAAHPEMTEGVIGTGLFADGNACELLYIQSGGSSRPASAETVANREHFIRMRGREVFKLAVTAMEDAAIGICERHGVKPSDLKLVIPHQANLRIIESIAARMELTKDQVYINVDRFGNTSAASIPIALDEARKNNRIQSGDLVLLVAFGAGLTWASALIRWH